VAPRAGFEPATQRLTAACSTTELPGIGSDDIGAPLAEGQAHVGTPADHLSRDGNISLIKNMVKSILELACLLFISYFDHRNKFLTIFLG
jgi:hypothetical protein